jgi:hypothetical protein
MAAITEEGEPFIPDWSERFQKQGNPTSKLFLRAKKEFHASEEG